MKIVRTLRDLQPFGIEALTGEACGLNLRILCEVNERGRKILAATFGIPDFKLGESWNSTANGLPSVGSIMLERDTIRLVSVFALLESGYKAVYVFDRPAGPDKAGLLENYFDFGSAYGFREGDADEAELIRNAVSRGVKYHRHSYAGTAGSRNTHVFSGRVT